MLKRIVNRRKAKSSVSIADAVDKIRSKWKKLNKFLDEADTIEYEDQELSNHMIQVKEVTDRIEDVVEDYTNAVEHPQIPIERGVKKILRRLCCASAKDPFSKMKADIDGINEEIRNIEKAAKSQGITERLQHIVEEDTQRKLKRNINHEVEEAYIEKIDDIGKVVEMLLESRGDPFISIFNNAGSGKTIIAKKVYERGDVRQHFKCLAWIDRNQESEDHIVLQDLVKQLQEGADIPSNNNLQSLLEHNRCLIVLDDVRTLYQIRFLLRDVARANNSIVSSKVLITTCMSRVAEIGQIHLPRPWTQTESWDLLYKITKIDSPDEETDVKIKHRLEQIGRTIVDKCGRLPLKVATIGEVLRATPTSVEEWEKVQAKTGDYLRKGGGSVDIPFINIYNSLPPRLKKCFLYMALFLKDEPIEATRLYHLWIGEGLISEEDISSTSMDVAQSNLKLLASWDMIEVVRHNEATKDIEWCKLHPLKKDLLRKKAEKEAFFEILHINASDQKAQTKTHNLFNRKARRLVIRSGGGQWQDLNEMQSVRVILVSTDSDFTEIQTVRKFKYLKVLVFDGCSFPEKKLPTEIFNITTLRYLLLNPIHDIELPSDAAGFPYIQTLNLLGSHAIYVPNILGKMTKLKHLYLGYSCRPLASDKLQLEGLSELEILDIRNGCMVKLEDLPGLINLQILCINIDTEDIPNGKNYISDTTRPKWVRISTEVPVDHISVDAEKRLEWVLCMDNVNELVIKGTFELPAYEQRFWQNVSRLSIEETLIEGDPMKLLKHLPNLKELRLEDDEFMTDEIECDAKAFPELVYLKLKWCSHLKKWKVDKNAFPKLSRLTIIGCQDLKEIVPEEGLRNLEALTVIDIHHMPEDFQKYGFEKAAQGNLV